MSAESPFTGQGEEPAEQMLRPKRLSEFQGQEELKSNFAVFIKAALQRGEALDHIFLNGPPGLGKTTIACIIAEEMGCELKITSAPAIEKAKDLAGLLTSIRAGTVFFIDEIHRLRPALEEMLYTAMEDWELDWMIGQGPSARSVRIPIPRFTLVGATTKAGQVSAPLYTRFGITWRLNYYNDNEIRLVLRRTAGLLPVPLEEDALELLASCCRGTPRIANRILRRMRDYAQVEGQGSISMEVVRQGLSRLGIDHLGLEAHDREILAVIIKQYGGGPVGAETLAISVGESQDTLEDFYEPYLIQRGLMVRTPRGRMATRSAYEHLGLESLLREDQHLLF